MTKGLLVIASFIMMILTSCQNPDESIFNEDNIHNVLPTSITVLNDSSIFLSTGTQASVDFCVSTSNAPFDFNGDEFQISCVGASNYYKVVGTEQVFDDMGGAEVGHYRAIIEDNKVSAEYDEIVALVLNVQDVNGNNVQITSNTFEVIGKSDLFLVHNGLPIVVINTPDSMPIISKNNYVTGSTVSLLNADMTYNLLLGEAKIKGRGNTTWLCPKKPYKVKFDTKQSLFDKPKEKEWVLLANYYDKSMIRTDVAYWMASHFGHFDYVPRFHFVDMVMNGEYNGTYQLGDQLKISENRVNVGDDGFLLEIDAKATEEDITFSVPHINQKINIKDPDVVMGGESYNFVKDYVTRADEALFADDWLDEKIGYKSLIDMQSFVEWYVMMELTKNADANFNTSCYMNLSRTGKLKMGPLWDFDLGLGNYPHSWAPVFADKVNNPQGYYIKTWTGSWIARLFEDPAFVSAVKETYASYYKNKDAIIAYVESVAAANQKSAIENNKLWGTLCDKNSTNDEIEAAYSAQITFLKTWLSVRIEWLKIAFDAL